FATAARNIRSRKENGADSFSISLESGSRTFARRSSADAGIADDGFGETGTAAGFVSAALAAGICTAPWHLGHLPRFPASSSLTLSVVLHWGQVTEIGKANSWQGKRAEHRFASIVGFTSQESKTA